MTLDDCKLNHVASSQVVTFLDVALLPQQINASPGPWHAAIELANSFYLSKSPGTICFQPARSVIHFPQPNLEVYQLSSSLSSFSLQEP